MESERNLHVFIVSCLWQNRKRKFLKKQNLSRIYGEGIWMIYFFLWEHGEEKLKSFTKMNPSIKFTIDQSKRSINFLDVTISIAEVVIEIDLYVRSTNRHQDLLSSSCYPFYCKKGIPYSMQALRLNRISSNNDFFDKRCSNLKKYLLERGCSQRILRSEIIQARAITRDAPLEKVNSQEKQNRMTFYTSYYLYFG